MISKADKRIALDRTLELTNPLGQVCCRYDPMCTDNTITAIYNLTLQIRQVVYNEINNMELKELNYNLFDEPPVT